MHVPVAVMAKDASVVVRRQRGGRHSECDDDDAERRASPVTSLPESARG